MKFIFCFTKLYYRLNFFRRSLNFLLMGSLLGILGFGSSKENKDKDKDKPITIDKFDSSAVRNALDDSVRKVL